MAVLPLALPGLFFQKWTNSIEGAIGLCRPFLTSRFLVNMDWSFAEIKQNQAEMEKVQYVRRGHMTRVPCLTGWQKQACGTMHISGG